jgi:hypothetical protein
MNASWPVSSGAKIVDRKFKRAAARERFEGRRNARAADEGIIRLKVPSATPTLTSDGVIKPLTWPPKQVQAIIEAVYQAQREALQLPERDRQIRYIEHQPEHPSRTLPTYAVECEELITGRKGPLDLSF